MLNAVNLSGIEVLRAMSQGQYPGPTISQIIPMSVVALEPGCITFSARADGRHLNPMGGVHGGFASTVLDSATACAVHSLLDAGVGYTTIDLAIKMLRPVPMNEELFATGTVIHLSSRLGVSEGTLKDSQGTLLAHATASCMIFRPKPQTPETGDD
ncbi:PaaI family thioesterase [Desulfosarcina sp. OttesenSCG-928-B08]|nr:PaaI family thioesterase [Desulfosarcina sp. OttesenSCG-928-B08]